jgi:heme oxygenase
VDVSERLVTGTANAGRASQRPSLRAGSPGPSGTLARRLRAETDAAHRAAEQAFDLDQRLTSLVGYADALQALDAFAASSVLVLGALEPALPAALRDGPARRRSRLHGDLVRLGRIPTPSAQTHAPARADLDPIPAQTDLDHALGAWYVHEGAALGGLLIAAEVRRRLPQAAAATHFFVGEGRATAARWRAVQAVLDGWDPADGGQRVVGGALATFAALTEHLAEVDS